MSRRPSPSSSRPLPRSEAQPAGDGRGRRRRATRRPSADRAQRLVADASSLWILLVGFALLFLYPFAWLLAASLKPRGEVFDNALYPADRPAGATTPRSGTELPLLHWLGNSVVIAVLAAGLVALSSSLVAFGFAYFRFPGRRLLFGLVLGTMMLPGAGHAWSRSTSSGRTSASLGTWVPLFGA